MHYVKQFNINGIDTKQVACIELRGKPNAATEGCVGVLGIDMLSPLHEVYKCTAVNGSIYTWELLSSGTCIMSSIITGAGEELAEFPYDKLRTVANYVVKIGDVIIDKEGFLYQVESLNTTYCIARYNGTQIVSGMPKVGEVDNGKILSVVDGCHAFVPVEGSSVDMFIREKITGGEVIAGKANTMNYVLKAEGSWKSAEPTRIADSNIISTENFIQPNTRYLIKADGRLLDGVSNESGTQIIFHHIDANYGDGDSSTDIDVSLHESRILFREGKGLYFAVLNISASMTKLTGSFSTSRTLTHIYEGGQIPI